MGPIRNVPRTNRRLGVITAWRNYDECAAARVRGVNNSGHTTNYRMHFGGDVIYSYGNHFPLAKRVFGKGDVAFILLNTGSYSQTTSKQRVALRQAIDSQMGTLHSVFFVDTGAIHSGNVLAYYESKFSEAGNRMVKPRIRQKTREEARTDRLHYASEANRYAAAFGLTIPFPTNEAEALALALEDEPMREAA